MLLQTDLDFGEMQVKKLISKKQFKLEKKINKLIVKLMKESNLENYQLDVVDLGNNHYKISKTEYFKRMKENTSFTDNCKYKEIIN